MNYNNFEFANKLFDEGHSIDQIIDELIKVNCDKSEINIIVQSLKERLITDLRHTNKFRNSTISNNVLQSAFNGLLSFVFYSIICTIIVFMVIYFST